MNLSGVTLQLHIDDILIREAFRLLHCHRAIIDTNGIQNKIMCVIIM